MHINWYGQGCFKIQSKDINIFFDPFDAKKTGLQPPRIKDGLVLTGRLGQEVTIKNSANIFLVSTPGEYEVKNIFVYSIMPKDDYPIIIHHLETEGITIVHLGKISHLLDDEIVGELGKVDILMLPVGGKGMLDAKGAVKIVSQLNPRMVIPMYHKIRGINVDVESVDRFCKEIGAKNNPVEKLNIKKNNLPEETEIVILKP